MVELQVVFVGEPVAAEGVQTVGDGVGRRVRGPPEQHRDIGAGLGLAVGQGAKRPPEQHLGAVGVDDIVGQLVRNALVGADRLAEGDALGGVGRRHLQHLLRHADQRSGGQHLPLLDGGGPDLGGVGVGGDHMPLALAGLEGAQRRPAQGLRRLERLGRDLDRHLASVEGEHAVGGRAARDQLRLAGPGLVQGQRSTVSPPRTFSIHCCATGPPSSPSTRRAASDSASGAGASRRPACSMTRQASNRLMPPPPASSDRRMNGASSSTSCFQSPASKPTGSAAHRAERTPRQRTARRSPSPGGCRLAGRASWILRGASRALGSGPNRFGASSGAGRRSPTRRRGDPTAQKRMHSLAGALRSRV